MANQPRSVRSTSKVERLKREQQTQLHSSLHSSAPACEQGTRSLDSLVSILERVQKTGFDLGSQVGAAFASPASDGGRQVCGGGAAAGLALGIGRLGSTSLRLSFAQKAVLADAFLDLLRVCLRLCRIHCCPKALR